MTIHDTLQSAGKALPLVTIISPVYNTEAFLPIGIESIINQTYPNWELIFMDDGSTDHSAEIIERYMLSDSRIHLIRNENHGQGYERNRGLEAAKGEYVMFFDSDDYLEPEALDLAVTKLEREKTDFVVFDFCFYYPLGKTAAYKNKYDFFAKKKLEKTECTFLLKVHTFYTQNNVYRTCFLRENEVRYGEGYIYEDLEFWVKAVLSANAVSLIHSPLYRITINPTSSTQTRYNTDWHCRGFILAVKSVIDLLSQFRDKIGDRVKYDLLLYFYNKFVFYYAVRTPAQYKKKFMAEFMEQMSALGEVTDFKERKMISFLLRYDVFLKKKISIFKLAVFYSSKGKPMAQKTVGKLKNKVRSLYHKSRKFAVGRKIISMVNPKRGGVDLWGIYREEAKRSLYDNVILFMGFDYRFTGNSRYLFEEMRTSLPDGLKIFFVTDSSFVPLENRIKPNSERMYRFVARAKIIIFESWIPERYVHRKGTTWIQLWHGTPLKRLMFDSNEKQITGRRLDNKIRHWKDIQRWDYLLTDSPEVKSYFETCFLFPQSRQLPFGYPRVKYLLEKKNRKEYIDFLKKHYGVPAEKKIVLYLPTWRDYNYRTGNRKPNDFDTDYLVDLKQLQNLLGKEYEIIYKDHVYLSKPENVDFKNYSDAETQELLLMADCLLTDYSSVMFDAMAIDLPVVLYCNDFDRNEEDRGVYEEMWGMLQPFVCTDVRQVCDMIKKYSIDENYLRVKEKFAHKPTGEDLVKFILDKAQR